jgi:hypothetical protein
MQMNLCVEMQGSGRDLVRHGLELPTPEHQCCILRRLTFNRHGRKPLRSSLMTTPLSPPGSSTSAPTLMRPPRPATDAAACAWTLCAGLYVVQNSPAASTPANRLCTRHSPFKACVTRLLLAGDLDLDAIAHVQHVRLQEPHL